MTGLSANLGSGFSTTLGASSFFGVTFRPGDLTLPLSSPTRMNSADLGSFHVDSPVALFFQYAFLCFSEYSSVHSPSSFDSLAPAFSEDFFCEDAVPTLGSVQVVSPVLLFFQYLRCFFSLNFSSQSLLPPLFDSLAVVVFVVASVFFFFSDDFVGELDSTEDDPAALGSFHVDSPVLACFQYFRWCFSLNSSFH